MSVRWVIVVAALLLSGVTAAAQDMRAQQALLDSLANPTTVRGGEVMHFDRTRIDAGRMHENDTPRSYTFNWRNEGAKPLVVTRIVTTCGCAKADYPHQPVMAGESATVTVTYHPKGHPGRFLRRIFVYTQLSDRLPSAILELSGTVESGGVQSADYPHAMGALRLKQREVHIDGTQRQTERIECMNSSSTTMRPSVDGNLLPDYLSVSFEPQEIAAGKRADIVVRFDPSRVGLTLPSRVPVILEGLPLPPSGRTLQVIFDNNE